MSENMELSILKKTSKEVGKAFEKEEIIDYSEEIFEIQCKILKSGIKEIKDTYYICECDPERTNAICENCFNICHKGGNEYPHKLIRSGVMNAVCICGYRCHALFSESGQEDKQYKKNCTFGELAGINDLNFCFQSLNDSNTKICLICFNICYNCDANFIKKPLMDLKGFKCCCTHHNHSDIRIIFRKLRYIAKQNNFLKVYNFEGMTFVQFLNILTSTKNSFYNLFHSFSEKINKTYEKLQNFNYYFEDHNTLNDLHFTSQVLLVFAQRCKNVYSCKNRIEKKIDTDEDGNEIDNEDKKPAKNLTVGIDGGEISKLHIRCSTICYFNDIIKNILNEKIFFKIMERKFDFKSRNIWQLKYYLTSIFCNFYVAKDFSSYPNFKIRDISLLSPLQRYILITNIENDTKISQYVNNLNMNYLNNILNSIECLLNSEEKSIIFHLILAKLYKICELFAKYSLFNHEQLSKLCQLNDQILTFYDEEKKNADIDFLKIKVVSPMIKTLLFLSYYYNDQIIISALKGEREVEKCNFFHGKTEICKNVTQNVILALTFTQRFGSETIALQKEREKTKNETIEYSSDQVSKILEILPQKQRYIKCLRNVINNCNTLLELPLKIEETYQSGMVRLIDEDQEILYKIIKGNLVPNERDFIKKVHYFNEELEETYYNFFQEYNYQGNVDKFIQKYEDIITEFNKNYTFFNEDENNFSKKKDDEENSKFLDGIDNLSQINEEIENYENGVIASDNENIQNTDNNPKTNNNFNNKYIVTKSYLLQSMMKFIHILYYDHISKKNPPEKFFIKQSIFRIIMEILYHFTLNSPENSFFLLQSDFTSNFELLNEGQLVEALCLINTCLVFIGNSKRTINNNTNLSHLLKISILKSYNQEVLNEALKVLQTMVKYVEFIDEIKMRKKVMKILKIIFNYHLTFKNYFILMASSRENDKLQCFKKETEKLIKKYLRILTRLCTSKKIIEEREFLETITGKEQLKRILYAKTINISLRTELLEYYRKCYLETVLDTKDTNYFASALINDFKPEKKDEIIENPKYYKFFEFLVKSGNYTGLIGLENEANVVKFELLNFQGVLTMTTDKVKIKKYIEVVVKCVIVYFSKFSSLIFDSSGYNCISLYEIIYYFLDLKKYIYSRPEVFSFVEKKKFVFFSTQNKTVELINPDKIIIHDDNKEKEKTNEFDKKYLKKEKKNKIKNPKNEEERINFDLRRMKDENFEFLNYANLREIFLSHTQNFIEFPEVEGYKDYFEKKNQIYDEEKKKNIISKFKKQGKYKTQFEQDILSLIFHYYNMKCVIDTGSFIKALTETSAHYNTNYRMLLCKCILFYNKTHHQKYRQTVLWFLFKLLQYDTTEIQAIFEEIEENNEKNTPLFDFNNLVDSFTSSVIYVILKEINFNGYENRIEYFNSIMDIKIMKYFCEEHNPHFQTLFFNNTELSEKDVIVRYKNHLKIKKLKRKKNVNEDNEDYGYHKRKTIISAGSQISTETNMNGAVYSRKASVFEYLLSVLGKIILLSQWMNKRDNYPDEYFYDIYFVILEFLIETIQGTSSENLAKIFTNEKKKKYLFAIFLSEVNKLLIDDSFDDDLNYVIRKDLMDFLMAFLEESATPSNGIIEISSTLLPGTILDSIIATMNKLYIEEIEKQNKKEEDDEDEDNQVNNNNNENLVIKKNYCFTPEMKKFFSDLYFNDLDFGSNDKFALANRMYQYFKMLGQSTNFKNPYVYEFYFKYDMFTEEQVSKAYYNKNIKLINKDTNAAIAEAKFNEQFLCVNFFESITRTIFVNKEDEDEPVSVIFTINPIVPLLSKISKEDFIDNVDRSDRYSKLLSLMERCDNFFEEIRYRQQSGKANCLRRLINDINFYYLEVLAFLITLTINLIMLCVLKGEGDAIYGDNHINFIIQDLGYFNLGFNALCIILWLIAKFNLLYMTECQKMIKEYQNKNDDDEDNKEIILGTGDKIKAAYIVLIKKNKLFAFVWNIILSAFASFYEIYFIYILQLFIIFNLSQTLRNLITSMTVKTSQLGAVFYLSVVINLCLAAVAFFKFEEDFMRAIDSKMPHDYPDGFDYLNDLIGGTYTEPSHIESECGTLAYCFATHMDYGMRFDGGIADRMNARSYNLNKSYYIARFVYEVIYFISQTVMLQGMIFGIIIEAFSELRNKEQKIEKDKNEICFICGIDKGTCEKNGQKFEEHINKVHNLWTYVDYILGLRFVDIQETNAINSYVMETIEKKELSWFPSLKDSNEENGGGGDN